MRKTLALLMIILLGCQLSAIIVETASLKNFLFWEEENCDYDNWVSHIAEGIASANYNLYAPYDRQTNGFGDFRIPTATDMTQWGYVTEAFLSHDFEQAQVLIDMYGYPFQVVQFNDTDSGRTYYMIREIPNWEHYDDNGTIDPYDDEHGAFDYGWGLFIYNPASTRPLIITVPHPCDDYPTPNVGYETFQLWNAKFLLINGAGREVKWTNVAPFYNSKSLSDPTRVANHPFNVVYNQACDLIRAEFGVRELSVQHHTYDWNRHVGMANVQVSAGNARRCPNLPIRDLSNLKHDLINQGDHLMIPANTYGTHEDVYLNDYYTVYYEVHDFIFDDGENSYPVNNVMTLPGAEGNRQMVYTLSGWNDYDSFDPFFHIEMDELPNAYDETENNLKWFYGWNEGQRRWDYANLYTNFNNYYSRWWIDLENVLDALFVMDDGTNPTDPTELTVHSQSLNHITLSWNRSYAYDFDTYEILYSTQPIDMGGYQTFNRNNNSFLASQACEQINVTGLSNSNLYYFQIRALDKNGNYSELSNEVMTRPAPANVTGMTAYGMDNSVRVYWTVSGQTNNQGFNVYRRTGDADWVLRDSYQSNPSLANTSVNSYEWWDTFVSNGTEYTYRISSTNNEDMEFHHNFPSSCSPRTIHQIYIKNAAGNLSDSIEFSNNPFATDGQDTYYDVSKGNPSGSNWVWNAFWQQYWGSQGTHLSREIKGEYDPDYQLKSWVMRVRSDQTGQQLRIEASDTFSRFEKLYLYDNGTGNWHNLLEGPYLFSVANSNTRTMTLYWGNLQPSVTHNSQPNRIYQGGTSASFYWSTQYNFLVDELQIYVKNATDSLHIASGLAYNTTSYTYMLPNDVEMPASKFYVDAIAVDGVRNTFESPYTFGVAPAMILSMNQDGWNMKSSIWSQDQLTIPQVFGEGADGYVLDYEGSWMLYNQFDFGTGYWVNSPEFSFYSSTTPIQRDSVSVALTPGWNLIPNPHYCRYELRDLLFWINGVRYKYGEVIGQKLVSPAVYVYRNGRYELAHSIEAFESFLIKYYGPSWANALITLVPYYNGPDINTQEPIWKLDISATQDEIDFDTITIGANLLSRDNYDFRFDLPNPIHKPFDSLNLYLTRDDTTEFMDTQLHREFREMFNPADEASKIWDFALEVPTAEPVHFAFAQELIPEGYTVTFIIDGMGHHLYNGNTFTFQPAEAGTYTGQIIVRNFPVGVSDVTVPALSGMKIYPNPFNPTTNIAFYLGKDANVSLDVYNMRGQRVTKLYHGFMKSGQQSVQWNGRDDSNRSVASGVYFVRVKTPGKTQTMKMMLMK